MKAYASYVVDASIKSQEKAKETKLEERMLKQDKKC